MKEYKFLVQFEDGTEQVSAVRQCKNNYIDRSLAIVAIKSRYKDRKIKSIKNASD